tara:strand:- start:1185 stop:2252 length:1068 start_codon:yes stop_codon:yes gene_type:complete
LSIEKVIDNKKVIVLLGAGGVGKTTCSIATAIRAAKLGKRVALISIDPARRLADALGLKFDTELKELKLDSSVSGCVYAMMIDQKQVFDQMIYRYSTSSKITKKILSHDLYKMISSKVSGSLEYMALAKLCDLVEDDNYDIVILDTPPDTNAICFLKKSHFLHVFHDNKVMTWLIKPFYIANRLGFSRFVKIGGKLINGLTTVTGIKSLALISEFAILMQSVIQGFNQAGKKIQKILNSFDSSFILVTNLNQTSYRSSRYLFNEIKTLGYNIDALYLNRCLPGKLIQSIFSNNYDDMILIGKIRDKVKEEEKLIEKMFKDLSQLNEKPLLKIRIDDQFENVNSLSALHNFSKKIL